MALDAAVAALCVPLARLPGRLRRAIRHFHRLTGVTAVVTVATSLPDDGEPITLSPPVHPRCARRLQSVAVPPCRQQWAIHLRSARRSRPTRRHKCPIGLRCAGIPIRLGGRPVGLAKVVVDGKTSDDKLLAAVKVLQLALEGASSGSVVSVLSEDLASLRRRVLDLQQVRARDGPGADVFADPGPVPRASDGAVVQRALDYLQRSYQNPALSLPAVAEALRCNPRYLTARFTQVTGERMHGYLASLRVAHARRLLLATGISVKLVAFESGFHNPTQLERSFRRLVGVPPREYRRLYAAP